MKRSGRKDIIDKMVGRGTLTPDGARALVLTLDPFHDTNVTPIGLPDELPGTSVIQVVKTTRNIAAPSGLGATATWDVHIATLPELATFDGTLNGSLASQVVTVTNPGSAVRDATWIATYPEFPLGPVVVSATNSGSPTFPNGGAPGANTDAFAMDYSKYQSGQSRLIGLAFEVHNTTADLYRQGTVTVYRLPQNIEDGDIWFDDDLSLTTGHINNPAFTKVSRLPPGSAAEAMLLPDSKQWEAAHGTYCVSTFDHELNRPAALTRANRLFQLGDFDLLDPPAAGDQSLWGVLAGRSNGRYTAGGYPAATLSGDSGMCKPVPCNTSGAIFTGLSIQTTLTLTVHAIIETFPSQFSPLVTLARPTPDFDPIFFALYKEIVRDLPPGVMVAENASGDFWDKVLGIVETAAPVVGSLFPGVGTLIGGGVSMAAKAGRAARNSDSGVDNKFTGSNSNSQPISKILPVIKSKAALAQKVAMKKK